MSITLEECIEKLGPFVEYVPQDEADELFENVQEIFHFKFGHVDWRNFLIKKVISNHEEIKKLISDSECYVFWDEYTLPVLKVKLDKALDISEELKIQSFDMWLISVNLNWIVEFHHEGQTIFGEIK